MYTWEFKAEGAALAQKREKPIVQVAGDLGIGDTVSHRWTRRIREAAGEGSPPFPGLGRTRDEELARLRKGSKDIGNAA